MDQQTYSIFEGSGFSKVTEGLKLAQCMKGTKDIMGMEAQTTAAREPEELNVSEMLFCSFCNISFEDKIQQRLHYKLDWHRYNLKQNLIGRKYITEEQFQQLADDVSSISGSESGSEDEEDRLNSLLQSDCDINNKDVCSKMLKDNENDSNTDHKLQIERHSKVFFENSDGKIISVYRCILHKKKDMPENNEELISILMESSCKSKWAILMLGGGHFAAAIFNGRDILVHKTFHSYTVRARQGGTQSSRDGRTGGSHPKSAGASLRRYNEASFNQHIQEILSEWKQHLDVCNLIIFRAVGYNRTMLFGGRNPLLDKNDSRLRAMPIPTRRATFKEVKRIHNILSSIEVHGKRQRTLQGIGQIKKFCLHLTSFRLRNKFLSNLNKLKVGGRRQRKQDHAEASTASLFRIWKGGPADAFQASLPHSPRRKESRKEDKQDFPKQSGEVSKTDKKQKVETDNSRGSILNRIKSQSSPNHPLPRIVTDILVQSSSDSSEADEHDLSCADVEISFSRDLQQFHDTLPQRIKEDRKEVQKERKKKRVVPKAETESCSEPVRILRRKLLTACKMGNTNVLEDCLVKERKKPGDICTISPEELVDCLNETETENGNGLLHIAAEDGNTAMLRILLEAGCNPNKKNKKSQPPYAVSADKETRNAFRRFMGDYPERYDYSKSQIPGPLTEELEQQLSEKRKALKKAKREREKEKKKEDQAKREEEGEKERFLKLSDREKRALAAERRILASNAQGKTSIAVVSRCFECANDITGKVPFEYDIYRFCSVNCLKQHRLKMKLQQINK